MFNVAESAKSGVSSTDVDAFTDHVGVWLRDLETSTLNAHQARQLCNSLARLHRVAGTACSIVASRVDETSGHVAEGARNVGTYLAKHLGTNVGAANEMITTAQRVESLPASKQMLCAGEISVAQAAPIAAVASTAPEHEAALLHDAKVLPLRRLRAKCIELEARLDPNPDPAPRRRAKRTASAQQEDDLMVRIQTLLPPEMAGEFKAVWDAFTNRAFRTASAIGERQTAAQYAADGLLAMARCANVNPDGAHKPVQVHMIIRVDATAIERGHALAGEVCEIVGVGPIDVPLAKRLMGNAIIDIVVHGGIDVRSVAHAGHHTNRVQRAALLSRTYVCETEGCGHDQHLEIDHILEYAKHRWTDVGELGYKCKHCHRLKSNKRYRDGPKQSNGTRTLIPPSKRKADAA